MNATKGYYSLVQFCPDPSRLEAVNLGVLLFCPEVGFIAARTAKSNERATKLVGRGGIDNASLNSAKQAIERRLDVERERFVTLEDLQSFVDTRGNTLKLTDPRPVKVLDPQKDLVRLFDGLVGGRSRPAMIEFSPAPLLPQLDAVFQELRSEGRARLDVTVQVPVSGEELHIPYVYRNGVVNLVKPERFSSRPSSAVRVAKNLAMEGDLLSRFGEDEEGKKNLIVVSSFEPSDESTDVQHKVFKTLQAYNVKTVRETQLDEFVAEVRKEAHR